MEYKLYRLIVLFLGMLFAMVMVYLIDDNFSTHRGTALLAERGYVVETQYQAESNQVGYTYDGNSGLGFHTLSEDEKFMVVLKCDHGKVFTINKSEIFGKVSKGDTVTIEFFEMLNSDNEVVDYKFIDAYPK